MILDRLEHLEMYRPLSDEIALALDYLRRTDFSKVADGRYDLDGDRVFAIVMRYQAKPVDQAGWEAHRRYLDVQYVAEGVERMGYAPLKPDLAESQAYDSQKDLVFYKAHGSLVEVSAGMFAIFGPQDIHAPCLAAEGGGAASQVCKVVVKCRLADA